MGAVAVLDKAVLDNQAVAPPRSPRVPPPRLNFQEEHVQLAKRVGSPPHDVSHAGNKSGATSSNRNWNTQGIFNEQGRDEEDVDSESDAESDDDVHVEQLQASMNIQKIRIFHYLKLLTEFVFGPKKTISIIFS